MSGTTCLLVTSAGKGKSWSWVRAAVTARIHSGLITGGVPVFDVQVVVDAQRMPFADRSMRAIIMTNDAPYADVSRFFAQASRCLRPGKNSHDRTLDTSWSSFIYKYFHHEPFRPEAAINLFLDRTLGRQHRGSLDGFCKRSPSLKLISQNFSLSGFVLFCRFAT